MKAKNILMTLLLVTGAIAAKAAGYPPELALVSQPVMVYNANSITVYYDVENIGDYTYRGSVYIYLDPDAGYYYADKWVKVYPGRIKRIAIDIPANRIRRGHPFTIMPYYELGDELYSFTTFEYFDPITFYWDGPRNERWVVINVAPCLRHYHRPGTYRYYYDGFRPPMPPKGHAHRPMDPKHHTYSYHHNNGGYPANHNNGDSPKPHDNSGATVRPNPNAGSMSHGSSNANSSNSGGSNSGGSNNGSNINRRPNSSGSNVSRPSGNSSSSTSRPSGTSSGERRSSSVSNSSSTSRPSSTSNGSSVSRPSSNSSSRPSGTSSSSSRPKSNSSSRVSGSSTSTSGSSTSRSTSGSSSERR